MDKLIEQALLENKIVRYIPTFVQVLKTYKRLLDEAEASSEGVAVCCDTCKYVDGFRCNHPQGCETYGDYELWEQRTDL